MECLRNGEKAFSVLSKHLDVNTGEPCHSGHSVEDVASSVLDAMWAMPLESPDKESARKSPGDRSGEDNSDNKANSVSG